MEGDAVDSSCRANVRSRVVELKKCLPILAEKVATGELQAIGAFYDLDKGRVELVL